MVSRKAWRVAAGKVLKMDIWRVENLVLSKEMLSDGLTGIQQVELSAEKTVWLLDQYLEILTERLKV